MNTGKLQKNWEMPHFERCIAKSRWAIFATGILAGFDAMKMGINETVSFVREFVQYA